jgi:hypothetical protein
MSVASTTYAAAGTTGPIANKNIKALNGRGQVRQEKARGPDSGQQETWDAVDTVFNNLGQGPPSSRGLTASVQDRPCSALPPSMRSGARKQ